MHAAAISRAEERHRRRGSSGKRAVVAHTSPQAAGSAFALGQHRHGGVVGVDALGREHVSADRVDQRHQRRRISRTGDPQPCSAPNSISITPRGAGIPPPPVHRRSAPEQNPAPILAARTARAANPATGSDVSRPYAATLSGLALMPGGLAILFIMPVAGALGNYVPQNTLMAVAMFVAGIGMWHSTPLASLPELLGYKGPGRSLTGTCWLKQAIPCIVSPNVHPGPAYCRL
jgi:hypothetical protein